MDNSRPDLPGAFLINHQSILSFHFVPQFPCANQFIDFSRVCLLCFMHSPVRLLEFSVKRGWILTRQSREGWFRPWFSGPPIQRSPFRVFFFRFAMKLLLRLPLYLKI